MWLAIYLPALPLQAFSRSLIESAPVAVFERGARRSHIVARNQKAARLGIQVGNSLAEANALTDTLVALPREPLRETALLHRLAEATSSLTPHVHISAALGVLLNISASIKLFNGLQCLQQRAQAISEALHLRTHVIVAPTASGARWLARAHRQLIVERDMGGWLDDLMLDCTDIAPEVVDTLDGLNLHHLGAVRRIASATLGQRFGQTLPLLLARAYGELSEELPYWQPVVRFSETVEFLDLAREQAHWMPGVEDLLQRLQAFLRSRASSTQAIVFRFRLGSLQQSDFPIQAAHPIHQAADWLRLFNARLDRIPIAHEVSSVELTCERVEAMGFVDVDLFDHSREREGEWAALTTLIKLRLGDTALQPASEPACALPEVPLRDRRMVTASAAHGTDLRPTLLYDPPTPLSHREVNAFTHSIPMHYPERIHEHWQPHPDRESTLRDYYIARTPDERMLWVFRKRPENHWFLQGVFA
jgi:protein ImuB